MEYDFNSELLSSLVKNKRGPRGLREVASEIGTVSPSTLSRIEKGARPDMEVFLALCDWLEMWPGKFFSGVNESTASSGLTSTCEMMVLQIQADKRLDVPTTNALTALVKAAYKTSRGANDGLGNHF